VVRSSFSRSGPTMATTQAIIVPAKGEAFTLAVVELSEPEADEVLVKIVACG
jgi:Zn-dependent alcohol dehydrogenase